MGENIGIFLVANYMSIYVEITLRCSEILSSTWLKIYWCQYVLVR